MRRISYGGLVVVVSFVLAFGALAAPREQRSSREKQNPVVRAVKRIIQALGDGLIIPTPYALSYAMASNSRSGFDRSERM